MDGFDPFGKIINKNEKFYITHVCGSPYLARYVSKNKGKATIKYVQTFHAIYFKEDYPDEKNGNLKREKIKHYLNLLKKQML